MRPLYHGLARAQNQFYHVRLREGRGRRNRACLAPNQRTRAEREHFDATATNGPAWMTEFLASLAREDLQAQSRSARLDYFCCTVLRVRSIGCLAAGRSIRKGE
jgi:hypothetical protein